MQINEGQPNAGQPNADIDLDGVFNKQDGVTPVGGDVYNLDTDKNVPPIHNNDTPPVLDGIKVFIGDNVTEESKAFRDEILTEVNGSTITEQGILNNKGEVVLNVQDLNSYLETGKLPTNDAGQTTDSQGNILDDTIPPNTAAVDDSLVLKAKTQIQEAFGLDIQEDFEDTEDGLLNLTAKAVELSEERAINTFLENNPIINDFVNHLKIGGNPNDFNADLIDYDSINTTALSTDAKLDFIKRKLTSQGLDNADTIIDLFKTAGEDKVLEETRKAIDYLRDKQEQDSLVKQQEAQRLEQQERESVKKYWGEVKETVNKGKINNISIPINDRQKFFEYLSKPVAGNKSQEMLDAEKEPMDFELMVSYLRYKKGDIGKLTAVLAAENKVNSLRERMNKHNTSMKGNGTVSNQGNPNAGIDINKIF
jgi:hypothetical protein